MDMTERQREVVFRIRQLQAREENQQGLNDADFRELWSLKDEAKKNEWLYW